MIPAVSISSSRFIPAAAATLASLSRLRMLTTAISWESSESLLQNVLQSHRKYKNRVSCLDCLRRFPPQTCNLRVMQTNEEHLDNELAKCTKGKLAKLSGVGEAKQQQRVWHYAGLHAQLLRTEGRTI